MTNPVLPIEPAKSIAPRTAVMRLTVLIATVLLANFLVQLPNFDVADWGYFSFYDPGTVYKGDALLAKGYVPTIDFGYTHGLLSLLYAHIGLAVFGRTPATFFILTILTEMVMAWSLARLLVALQLRRMPRLLFFVALPIAIMPAYLTLTHPLEAMLILLALADQAEGKHSRALAIMTACLFAKPSMAYVYGFVLLIRIATRNWRRLNALLRAMLPAVATLVVTFAILACWMGVGPVIHTLFPVTGMKTYAVTGFGFFAPQGRAFWLTKNAMTYIFTPAGIFLVAAITTAAGAVWVAGSFPGKRAEKFSPRSEMLLTFGILHTAFLLGFYGWTGSWAYYSYLPLLGLALALDMLRTSAGRRRGLAMVLIIFVACSHGERAVVTVGSWNWKTRTAERLWIYPEQLREWQELVAAVGKQPGKTLVMSNGYVQNLPAGFEMQDAWFPEPGIPTGSEVARVLRQVEAAEYVVVWRQYDRFDLWNSGEFGGIRGEFEGVASGKKLMLLRRKH